MRNCFNMAHLLMRFSAVTSVWLPQPIAPQSSDSNCKEALSASLSGQMPSFRCKLLVSACLPAGV